MRQSPITHRIPRYMPGDAFFAGHRPQGHLLAALCERGDVGIAPCEMTCRAGPMCPAAKDTFSPAGHAGPALQGARVLGGQSRPPPQSEALSLRGAKRRGNPFSPCLPLRGRWQREALTEGELSYGFPLPQSAAPTAPSQGGLTARQRRADGTSYPKGICSAALHCRTASPTERFTAPVRRAGKIFCKA